LDQENLQGKVQAAVSGLARFPQRVVQLMYGLGGTPPLTEEQIADALTLELTDDDRRVLSQERGCDSAEVRVAVQDVQRWEIDALRGLRSKK
jgi:hypothetical protein